jgi:hypothetical protein
MKTEIITITPDLAAHLLTANIGNRKVTSSNVDYWCACLKGGDVKLTHQGIAIHGTIANPIRLIDGQHRLMAIVKTGIPAKFLVAEEVPMEAFAALDNGKPRSMADRAQISNHLAQICSSFFYLSSTHTISKPPVKLIQELAECIRPYYEKVTCKHVRTFSQNGVIVAFIMQQKKYGINDAEAFQSHETQLMPSGLKAVYKRLISNPPKMHGSSGRIIVAALVWHAIENPNNIKSTMPSETSKHIASEISNVFPEILTIINSYRNS